jgi:hypothetical protein
MVSAAGPVNGRQVVTSATAAQAGPPGPVEDRQADAARSRRSAPTSCPGTISEARSVDGRQTVTRHGGMS